MLYNIYSDRYNFSIIFILAISCFSILQYKCVMFILYDTFNRYTFV